MTRPFTLLDTVSLQALGTTFCTLYICELCKLYELGHETLCGSTDKLTKSLLTGYLYVTHMFSFTVLRPALR